MLVWAGVPPLPAMMLSGAAAARALKTISVMKWPTCMRAATAAGNLQLTMLPSGAVMRTGRMDPSLMGISGSKALLTAMNT